MGFNRELTPSPVANGMLMVIFADDLVKTESAVREAGRTIVKETFEFPGGFVGMNTHSRMIFSAP